MVLFLKAAILVPSGVTPCPLASYASVALYWSSEVRKQREWRLGTAVCAAKCHKKKLAWWAQLNIPGLTSTSGKIPMPPPATLVLAYWATVKKGPKLKIMPCTPTATISPLCRKQQTDVHSDRILLTLHHNAPYSILELCQQNNWGSLQTPRNCLAWEGRKVSSFPFTSSSIVLGVILMKSLGTDVSGGRSWPGGWDSGKSDPFGRVGGFKIHL